MTLLKQKDLKIQSPISLRGFGLLYDEVEDLFYLTKPYLYETLLLFHTRVIDKIIVPIIDSRNNGDDFKRLGLYDKNHSDYSLIKIQFD